MLKKEEIDQLKEVLEKGTDVVISTHKGPDGDAIGSSTALANVLQKLGNNVTIVVPDGFPVFLQWMHGANEILQHDTHEEVISTVQNAKVIFSLDYNDLSRVGEIGEAIAASSALKIMIDHHEEPKYQPAIQYWDAACCSTAQLVYDFLEELDWLNYIDQDVAASIYTGLVTDTGSFRFPSVNARTHEIVAALIRGGFQHHLVHEATFDGNTKDRLALNGYAVSEKLELIDNGRIAIISLTKEELSRFNARKGDTEGLVNKALSIQGVQMAVFFREADDKIKISFRSKGDVFVNEFARDHFSGGGHKYAAGGMSLGNMNNTIARFKENVNGHI